jgi:hypothetical protein
MQIKNNNMIHLKNEDFDDSEMADEDEDLISDEVVVDDLILGM